jgi:hypothetical protein
MFMIQVEEKVSQFKEIKDNLFSDLAMNRYVRTDFLNL